MYNSVFITLTIRHVFVQLGSVTMQSVQQYTRLGLGLSFFPAKERAASLVHQALIQLTKLL